MRRQQLPPGAAAPPPVARMSPFGLLVERLFQGCGGMVRAGKDDGFVMGTPEVAIPTFVDFCEELREVCGWCRNHVFSSAVADVGKGCETGATRGLTLPKLGSCSYPAAAGGRHQLEQAAGANPAGATRTSNGHISRLSDRISNMFSGSESP